MPCKSLWEYIYSFAINFNKTRMKPVKPLAMIHLCTLTLICHNLLSVEPIWTDKITPRVVYPTAWKHNFCQNFLYYKHMHGCLSEHRDVCDLPGMPWWLEAVL